MTYEELKAKQFLSPDELKNLMRKQKTKIIYQGYNYKLIYVEGKKISNTFVLMLKFEVRKMRYKILDIQ